jgi:hypothetical protein
VTKPRFAPFRQIISAAAIGCTPDHDIRGNLRFSNALLSASKVRIYLAHVVADQFHFELLDATECAVYVCVKIDDVSVINHAGH